MCIKNFIDLADCAYDHIIYAYDYIRILATKKKYYYMDNNGLQQRTLYVGQRCLGMKIGLYKETISRKFIKASWAAALSSTYPLNVNQTDQIILQAKALAAKTANNFEYKLYKGPSYYDGGGSLISSYHIALDCKNTTRNKVCLIYCATGFGLGGNNDLKLRINIQNISNKLDVTCINPILDQSIEKSSQELEKQSAAYITYLINELQSVINYRIEKEKESNGEVTNINEANPTKFITQFKNDRNDHQIFYNFQEIIQGIYDQIKNSPDFKLRLKNLITQDEFQNCNIQLLQSMGWKHIKQKNGFNIYEYENPMLQKSPLIEKIQTLYFGSFLNYEFRKHFTNQKKARQT